MNRLLEDNLFVRILSTVEGPELIHVRDNHFSSVLLSFGTAEQCTRQEKFLRCLMSGSNDVESGEIDMFKLFDLMGPLIRAIDMYQQQFPPYLERQSHDAKFQPSLVSPSAALHPWELAAAINEVLDPWINARQRKKESNPGSSHSDTHFLSVWHQRSLTFNTRLLVLLL